MGYWTIRPEPYDSAIAAALWREYYTEVSDRWHLLHEGRSTAPDELERGIAGTSGAEFGSPGGVLLVLRYAGEPVGTVGVHLLDVATAELSRVFVRVDMRGRGGGAVLLAAAEDTARRLGAGRIVLDTRHDLVEARALYLRHGYVESEPHNDGPYADHWFCKLL